MMTNDDEVIRIQRDLVFVDKIFSLNPILHANEM